MGWPKTHRAMPDHRAGQEVPWARPRARGGPQRPEGLRDGPSGVTGHREGRAEEEEGHRPRAGDTASADLRSWSRPVRAGWHCREFGRRGGGESGLTVQARPGWERQNAPHPPTLSAATITTGSWGRAASCKLSHLPIILTGVAFSNPQEKQTTEALLNKNTARVFCGFFLQPIPWGG